MSEITPASNLKSALDVSLESNKTGVDLAPIHIAASLRLWCIELAFYSCFICAVTIALLPFFLKAFYWSILWLLFLLATGFVLRQRWLHKNSPPICLSVHKKLWQLKNSTGEVVVEPFGEILLWSGVIILPLREIMSRREHRIVVMKDSVEPDDWRRLRVWLRTGLRNNM